MSQITLIQSYLSEDDVQLRGARRHLGQRAQSPEVVGADRDLGESVLPGLPRPQTDEDGERLPERVEGRPPLEAWNLVKSTSLSSSA